jgi:hypothetical protein
MEASERQQIAEHGSHHATAVRRAGNQAGTIFLQFPAATAENQVAPKQLIIARFAVHLILHAGLFRIRRMAIQTDCRISHVAVLLSRLLMNIVA